MELEKIHPVLGELPREAVLGGVVAVLVIAALLLWYIISVHKLHKKIRRAPEDEEAAAAVIERLKRRRPGANLVRRVLETIPDKALFSLFLSALEHEKVGEQLKSWMDESEDMFVYRRLALSGKGEAFDGSRAASLFASHIDRIREMTGDPEWPARYFAVKILLYDNDERSLRAVQEMREDPHTLVRKTLIEEYSAEGEEFFPQLLSYLIDDAAFEVRQAAKKRIMDDFTDRYEIDYSSLSPVQSLHIIEQFDPESSEDKNTALHFLEDKNLELRFAAAQFLEGAGTLQQLLLEADMEDRDMTKRNLDLLKKAAEVHIDSFLEKIRETDNPASLMLASELLTSSGNEELIPVLAEKVFSRVDDTPEEYTLLVQTVSCIRERGPEAAVRRLLEELDVRKHTQRDAELLLDSITDKYQHIAVKHLKSLLKDSAFEYREKLHEAFLRMETSYYIDELFLILKSGREVYSHPVRISALLLLGKLKLTYCMQFLLEQMPVLPFGEARDFSTHLKEYGGKEYQKRVLELLEQSDGKVRAALISAVPATGVKEFLKPIREAVKDADPEVRRASVWALLEYGDQKSIKESTDLLRDPVERVRIESARALGSKGKPAILDHFQSVLADENEVESVKHAALEGLAESGETKSVDILVEQLRDRAEELAEPTITALAKKSDQKLVKTLIGHLKDAGPELRDYITEAFKRMGEECEPPLLELLREDIASLTPHITYVLEETGYVEHTVRKLNHRDAQVRRDAAEVLSRIGTTSAFRGIVLASRDPDEEVRVMVTKALERLNSESGNEILEALKNDPEKRIRKYTLWALERISSKNSE
ncbi:MAG: HEAT repeat domain-containing protein [Spirochaetaceae bacterium]